MDLRKRLFQAILLSFALNNLAAPPVLLPSGELGSLRDLILQQQSLAKKEVGTEEPFVIKPTSNRTAKSGALIKRGIGFWGTYGGVTDLQALTALKDLAWWYTWGSAPTSAAAANLAVQYGIEFVPMVWSPGSGTGGIPAGSKNLLGYNEPNVRPQANTDPWTAASNWDNFNRVANQYKLAKGTPSAVPCPGADYSSDCVLRAGWDWWDQYYASCAAQNRNCTADFVATHLYSCSPTTLVSYIDTIWRRYRRPIWITEFACCLAGSTASADEILAQQILFMRTAMSIMDNDPRIVRYAWFAPRVTGFTCLGESANLMFANGSLTTLGKVYTNSQIDISPLAPVVRQAVTATIATVPLVGWDELCYVCDASSTFWGMQKLLKNAGNQPLYRSFINKCRLCGYEDEWNKVPL